MFFIPEITVWEAGIHTHTQNHRVYNQPIVPVSGVWEEPEVPGENPHKHEENSKLSQQ